MYVMLTDDADSGVDIDEALWQMLVGLTALMSAIAAVLFGAVMFVAMLKIAKEVYHNLYWPAHESEKAQQSPLLPQA
ncbi:hypothetical protein LTR95_008043 [Oleoguttula sp. CCFEE 5521]